MKYFIPWIAAFAFFISACDDSSSAPTEILSSSSEEISSSREQSSSSKKVSSSSAISSSAISSSSISKSSSSESVSSSSEKIESSSSEISSSSEEVSSSSEILSSSEESSSSEEISSSSKDLFPADLAVDLNLPSETKWAIKNIGADEPTDFGDYFAFGEITPPLPKTMLKQIPNTLQPPQVVGRNGVFQPMRKCAKLKYATGDGKKLKIARAKKLRATLCVATIKIPFSSPPAVIIPTIL